MRYIAPSLLSADFSRLREEVAGNKTAIFQTGKKFGKQPAQFLPLDIFRNLKRAKARRIRQKFAGGSSGY